MTDHISIEHRSWNMGRIKSANTFPEIKVRRFLRSLRVFYRKNYKMLPGKPDIVITKRKKVIFINGCFWHHHSNCSRATMPKTNKNYWKSKFQRTVKRDKENKKKLKKLGWNTLTLWECEIKKQKKLNKKIHLFIK